MLILLSGQSQAGCQQDLGEQQNQQKMGQAHCPGLFAL